MKVNVKEVLKLIGLYFLIYIFVTVVFVLLFHTPLLRGMEVMMYRGIVFIIITGILAGVILWVIKRVFKISYVTIKDVILLFCGVCCVNMVLFTLIPVTVERSVSVFMLSYMEENDGNYTTQDIEDIFVDKYVNEYGAFDKRFNEQIVSGNIEMNDDGTYSITDNGRTVVKMFRTVAKWFNTDQRLVYPNEN